MGVETQRDALGVATAALGVFFGGPAFLPLPSLVSRCHTSGEGRTMSPVAALLVSVAVVTGGVIRRPALAACVKNLAAVDSRFRLRVNTQMFLLQD